MSEKEQLHLFEAIKETLFPSPKIQGLLDDIQEAKFSGGLACLYCGSLSVKRNGKYRGRGRIKAEEIDSVIGRYIAPSSLLCTDSATNYKKFAKMKVLMHEVLPRGTYVSKSIYHIQHVNSFHSRLKQWMNRFQGVATKYIDNYMFWFRFIELHKKLDFTDRQKKLLSDTCKRASFTMAEGVRTGV